MCYVERVSKATDAEPRQPAPRRRKLRSVKMSEFAMMQGMAYGVQAYNECQDRNPHVYDEDEMDDDEMDDDEWSRQYDAQCRATPTRNLLFALFLISHT
jgi:hypothetical protein